MQTIKLYIRSDETCRQTVERYAQRLANPEDATRYFDHLTASGVLETDARWQTCMDFGLIGPIPSKYNPNPVYPRTGPLH